MRLSFLKYSARQTIRDSLPLESFMSLCTVRRYLGPIQYPYQQNTTLITLVINKCCSPYEMAHLLDDSKELVSYVVGKYS